MTDPVFIDFETEAIGPRPLEYPPKPVGLAVLDRTGQFASGYLGFGHHIENTATFEEVKAFLTALWASGREICCHNSMFDVDVAMAHFGLPFPDPKLLHDTLVLAFLHDPHADSLSLKDLSTKWLDDLPEERDELFMWLVENVPEVKRSPKKSGAHICRGPGELVGRYAMGDVRKTAKLFDYTHKVREEQPVAYLREIALMPILIANSTQGVRVNRKGMLEAVLHTTTDIIACEKWLRKYFKLEDTAELNFNSGMQLAKLCMDAGAWDQSVEWPRTETGTLRTDKDTLAAVLKDTQLIAVLRYRDLLSKLQGTYLEPWLLQSETTGRIYTEWNNVRGERGGTRTGRLSGKPTLQTMPVRYPNMDELPPDLIVQGIPKLREFILPDEGHKIISADFQAQELRIFAHFEDGALAAQYRNDPNVDLHQFTADMMSQNSGKDVTRTYAKGISFAVLYGAGPRKISEMLEIPYDLAKELMDAYQTSVAPGLRGMNADMSSRYARRAPLRTLGGRLIKGEPPKLVKGRLMRFDYKMINLLIQASAADQAKQAMIDYATRARDSRLLLSMHDELVISAKEEFAVREAATLTDAMCNALSMDVPMVAEAKIGNHYGEVK